MQNDVPETLVLRLNISTHMLDLSYINSHRELKEDQGPSTEPDQTYNITLYLDKLGVGARDVAMTVTPLNLSDLYVAGSGIMRASSSAEM